ncbi:MULTISPECIES: L,D-transpeptidase [unclassified Cyanobium]|uniref:L,D-transpeptidase n=1 Tax=unclassified Cyanobium TaxID=2627006 RepID=UPI0020CD425F|nr:MULTISPECIES: L,D-transpeptidase [unclassified Cyanobium]MCP9857968.1 L,D-transpeptidase [Cyanobium sp. Cruz-8H5]MCP9865417.1 L,D-transpeptidase [Cyanobium sp. Cruz-8D1]
MKRSTGLALLALAGGLAAPLAGPGPSALAVGTGSGQMVLVRTERQLPISGDPIWELQLLLPGQPPRAYEALVGRARRQDGDRDRLGSKAPLPRGRYAVTEITPVQPTDAVELGRFLWIGLQPDFPTARRGLGIHHDPSAGRGRSSGTDGCIGLIHGNDLLVLGDLLRRSGTTELLVRD